MSGHDANRAALVRKNYLLSSAERDAIMEALARYLEDCTSGATEEDILSAMERLS